MYQSPGGDQGTGQAERDRPTPLPSRGSPHQLNSSYVRLFAPAAPVPDLFRAFVAVLVGATAFFLAVVAFLALAAVLVVFLAVFLAALVALAAFFVDAAAFFLAVVAFFFVAVVPAEAFLGLLGGGFRHLFRSGRFLALLPASSERNASRFDRRCPSPK